VKRLPVIVIILFAVVSLLHSVAKQERTGDMYLNDVDGYYTYLPATFIYHDLAYAKFHEPREGAQVNFHVQPDGKRLNKYTIGVALMSAPFFLTAHVYTQFSDSYPADGYSYPYQMGGLLSTIFYAVLGLIFLYLFLKKYFGGGTVALALFCIGFGTNLFYYTANDAGMSHPISFALFAAVLLLTQRWYERQLRRHLFLLAFVGSLVILVRPVNAIFLLTPLLWGANSIAVLKNNFLLLVKDRRALVLSFLFFAVPLLLQFSYWHYITGQWVVNSYKGEYFKFSEPHVIDGLFSFRKGWFIYTPMALIAILGFIPLWKKQRSLVPGMLAVLCLAIYVTFCWGQWWYGGSFGCRPLIEYLALLALPLAAAIEALFSKRIRQELSMLVFVLVIALNQFQSYQFAHLIMHWDRMSAAAYFKIWGATEMSFEEYEPYLMSEKDYWQSVAEAAQP
jgi:hypothetical protein